MSRAEMCYLCTIRARTLRDHRESKTGLIRSWSGPSADIQSDGKERSHECFVDSTSIDWDMCHFKLLDILHELSSLSPIVANIYSKFTIWRAEREETLHSSLQDHKVI